jgi:hypothetical protein
MEYTMSELESLVSYDMYILGYNSTNPEDIKAYWEERLS